MKKDYRLKAWLKGISRDLNAPTLREYFEELRIADENLNKERDRRYKEVAEERAKALKIKEEADKVALQLAREIQTYKDEKANELRSQIESERGLYPTKSELNAAIKEVKTEIAPLTLYVSSQAGKSKGIGLVWGVLLAVTAAGFGLVGMLVGLVGLFLRFGGK